MSILENIKKILDPRDLGKVQHSLSTIIFTALCGVLAGCDNWNEIRDYCKVKKDWLSQHVSFKNGVPFFVFLQKDLFQEGWLLHISHRLLLFQRKKCLKLTYLLHN